MAPMTPKQRKLARYALGLPNETNRSTQNHASATTGTNEHDQWSTMARDRLAVKKGDVSCGPYGLFSLFRLTRTGALLALDEGESLDPEEFPEGGE